MAFTTEFRQAERLSQVIGVSATLHLCGFFGRQGSRIWVPADPEGDHLIKRVIGAEAYRELVAGFGGDYLGVPELDLRPLRAAGMVYRLHKRGIPTADIAQLAGINRRTVSDLKKQLCLEGLRPLAEALPDDEAA